MLCDIALVVLLDDDCCPVSHAPDASQEREVLDSFASEAAPKAGLDLNDVLDDLGPELSDQVLVLDDLGGPDLSDH